MTLQEIQKKLNQNFNSGTFFKLMDLKVVSLSQDKAVLTVACNQDTISFQGSLYGGVLSFAADVAIWAALVTRGFEQQVVTTDLNIHYLDRFEKGLARFEATILRRGKRMIMGEVNIYNNQNVLAAHVTGSFLKV